MNILYLALYYGLARFLPSSSACNVCVKLRRYLINKIFYYAGSNVNIAQGVVFGRGGKISIGNNSGIGECSRLVAMESIIIGDDVMIAPEVLMLTGGHKYDDPNIFLREHESLTAPIKIGSDCWIGARAIILPGVAVCNRVIIAAGSVVTKSITESGIYGGNPAKKIKDIPK